MTATIRSFPLLLLLPLTVLVGCPPTGGGDDPPPGPSTVTWEEDDDSTNGFAGDAEPVDITWTTSLQIEGSMEDCGYDSDEDWPWTGDEDNYRIEVPEEGYIDAVLTWEHGSDLDMLIYFSPPSGNSASPDVLLTSSNDNGQIEYLFDEPHDRGDDFILAVLCAQGGGGDYVLTVGWES